MIVNNKKNMKAYIKVEDRKPAFGQRVIALVCEPNDLGVSKYLWNVYYNDTTEEFEMNGKRVNTEFWLEETEISKLVSSDLKTKPPENKPESYNQDEEVYEYYEWVLDNYYKDADPHHRDGK